MMPATWLPGCAGCGFGRQVDTWQRGVGNGCRVYVRAWGALAGWWLDEQMSNG